MEKDPRTEQENRFVGERGKGGFTVTLHPTQPIDHDDVTGGHAYSVGPINLSWPKAGKLISQSKCVLLRLFSSPQPFCIIFLVFFLSLLFSFTAFLIAEYLQREREREMQVPLARTSLQFSYWNSLSFNPLSTLTY